MKKQTKTIEVFVCGVDWQHEIGEAGDNILYEKLDRLRHHQSCTGFCGIVKLKAVLSLIEWVEPQNLFREKEQELKVK